MQEEWKEVNLDGYQFLVSRCGKVKRAKTVNIVERIRNGKQQSFEMVKEESLLSQYTNSRGYKEVALMVGSKRKKFSVHRLVGMAFCDGYAPGLHIDHLNMDKTDNRADNLEWVSNETNVQRAWKHGVHKKLVGENNHASIFTSQQVRLIRRLFAQGATPHTLAELMEVSPETLRRIKEGVSWKQL